MALLHTKVPSVMEETPESPTEVDFHLWYDNYPKAFERERIEEHRGKPTPGLTPTGT